MIKKLFIRIVPIFVLLSLAFSVTLYADTDNGLYGKNIVSIETDNTFSIFPEDSKALSGIFKMTEKEIENYCKQNNIVYLSADNNNSRQIRITLYTSDFANSVVNISGMSDDKIIASAEDIVGTADIRGDVINKNGQKFFKIQRPLKDSGGDYILTQYFTIAERQNIVLSFYNSLNVDIDYINPIFESYTSPLFINEIPKESKTLYYVIPAVAGVLLIASLFLGYSVYKDLKSAKEVEYDEDGVPIDSEDDSTEE